MCGADGVAAGDGRSAYVHHHPHAAALGPQDHLGNPGPVVVAAEAHFAQVADAGGGHFLKVSFGETLLQQQSASLHLDAARMKGCPGLRGDNRQGFGPQRAGWAARHVYLAGGDQPGDAAMQATFNEVNRPLPGRVVADDRVEMGINQAGGDGAAVGVEPGCVVRRRQFGAGPNRGNPPIAHQDGIAVQQGLVKAAGDNPADIVDK